MNSSKTQSGSVIGYAIAAVVLLALLAGSFYLAKHWANNPSQTANNPTEQTGQPATNKPESNRSKSQSNDQNQPERHGSAANQQPSQSSQSGGSAEQSGGSNSGRSSGSIAPAGPTDVVQTVVGLSILTGSAVAYHRSRRSRQSA